MNKILLNIIKSIKDPSEFFYGLIRMHGKTMAGLVKKSAFYLQGQMDLQPKSLWYKKDFIDITHGYFPKNDCIERTITDIEPWDTTRRDMLVLFLRTITENNIPGDFAEVGVYKGSTAKLLHKYAPERKLHLFDTFAGFKERSVNAEKSLTGLSISQNHFADTNLESVQKYIDGNANVSYYQAYFPDILPTSFDSMNFSFVHLDADLYEPTFKGLEMFYPKMSTGAMIVVHDYNSWIGAREAVDTFFRDKQEIPIPMPDKSGSVLIVKL